MFDECWRDGILVSVIAGWLVIWVLLPHMNTEDNNAQSMRFKTASSKNRGINVSFHSFTETSAKLSDIAIDRSGCQHTQLCLHFRFRSFPLLQGMTAEAC